MSFGTYETGIDESGRLVRFQADLRICLEQVLRDLSQLVAAISNPHLPSLYEASVAGRLPDPLCYVLRWGSQVTA